MSPVCRLQMTVETDPEGRGVAIVDNKGFSTARGVIRRAATV